LEYNLLADESVDFRIIRYLRERNINIYSILENHPGIPDNQVIEIAKEKHCILITEDSDLGEFVFSFQDKANSIIFLRYDTKHIEEIKTTIVKVLDKYQGALYGKFVVITPNKIRLRDILR
jgi:predicted nuclease of predicted toxin-antitoxin system